MHLLKAIGNIKDIRSIVDVYRLLAGMLTEISQVNAHTISEEDYSSLSDQELELLSKLNSN